MKKILTIMLFMFLAAGIQAVESGRTLAAGPVDIPGLIAPEPGYGMVYVVREVGFYPHFQFHVYLDEAVPKERLGYTLGGQYIYFQAPAGKHRVISVGKNTKTISFDIKSGETIFIRQSEKVDRKVGSNQDNLEILPAESWQYALKHLVKGWIDEK